MAAKIITVESGTNEVTISYGGPAGSKGDTGTNGSLAWQDDWASDHGAYAANDFVYHAVSGYGKGLFRCILGHDPATAATEPVVGGSAATYWETSIGGGEDGTDGTDGTNGTDGADGVMSLWTTFPGTPTRVSDSQFTITDTGGANSYAAMFPKGTVIKWEKSGGGFQCAMIKAAAYDSNVVTIDILGNDLVAGFTDLKYCVLPALEDVFIIPGTLPGNTATADIGKTIYWPDDRLVFSVVIRYKTAATTTKGVWDVNDDGTSIFSTKPEIAAGANVGADQISDCVLDDALTVVAAGSAITLDYDSGHATTPGSDAYIFLYSMPHARRYIT